MVATICAEMLTGCIFTGGVLLVMLWLNAWEMSRGSAFCLGGLMAFLAMFLMSLVTIGAMTK